MRIHPLLCTSLLLICSASALKAQSADASMLWINVYGTPPQYQHMIFGNRIGNTTSGLDSSFTIPLEYREYAECPAPCPCLDVVWGPVRGGSQFGTGIRGLCSPQINGWSNETQIDTFRINFSQVDNANQDISFKWPNPAYIAMRCDSLVMVYLDAGSGTNVRLNMMSTDTLIIPAAGTNNVWFIRMFKYGAYLTETGVDDKETKVPARFMLMQNFPNPFNPATNIQYEVSTQGYVSLKIYDVLGREIATLENGVQSPGFKSVTWNASNVASGIYYYRLRAGNYTSAKKMILMR